jgi:uncharacterized caspase-like protein
MYGGVEVKLLADKDATRANLLTDLQWLEKSVTSRDVGVVFLAGHGVTDEQQAYWFLPVDASPDSVRINGVSEDDLRRTLRSLAGKAILFLDTCHAGKLLADATAARGVVDINSVVNDFASAENGVVAFASSTGREVSEENAAWGNGHGAFTEALLEAVGEGKADLLGQGTITLSELDAYVVNRVKQLTGGTQHPVMTRPATVPDFPIALAGR